MKSLIVLIVVLLLGNSCGKNTYITSPVKPKGTVIINVYNSKSAVCDYRFFNSDVILDVISINSKQRKSDTLNLEIGSYLCCWQSVIGAGETMIADTIVSDSLMWDVN
jgi:hypothetical protein